MGFFKRAVLSLEQRVAKHKDEFTEISKDIEAAVLLALHREHVDA